MVALLGLDGDEEAAETEYAPAVTASNRLLAAAAPDEAPPGTKPFAPREAKQAAEALRALIAEEIAGLESRRSRFTPTAVSRQRAIDEALVDDSAEGRLLHRYEMAHDRVLRATLKELMALEKSGADLAEEAEDGPDASAEAAAPTEANSAEIMTEEGIGSGPSETAARPVPAQACVEGPSGPPPGPAGGLDGPIGAVSGPEWAPIAS
jgi:hypothetical protein